MISLCLAVFGWCCVVMLGGGEGGRGSSCGTRGSGTQGTTRRQVRTPTGQTHTRAFDRGRGLCCVLMLTSLVCVYGCVSQVVVGEEGSKGRQPPPPLVLTGGKKPQPDPKVPPFSDPIAHHIYIITHAVCSSLGHHQPGECGISRLGSLVWGVSRCG